LQIGVAVARALIRPDTLCAWKGPSLLVLSTRGECGPGQALSSYLKGQS